MKTNNSALIYNLKLENALNISRKAKDNMKTKFFAQTKIDSEDLEETGGWTFVEPVNVHQGFNCIEDCQQEIDRIEIETIQYGFDLGEWRIVECRV